MEASPSIQLGIAGGTRWLEIIDAHTQGDTLADKIAGCDETGGPRRTGLEILDLSDQGVSDWHGSLIMPWVARLALLGSERRTGAEGPEEIVPLVMDYSIQVFDGAQAAAFLDLVITGLTAAESGTDP